MENPLGTLIRCPDVTEERLAFYQRIGLDMLQLAGVNEEYLAPTPEAKRKSDALFALFEQYGLAVPCLFLSFPQQDWSRARETTGLVPEAFRAERMLLACRQMTWAHCYGIRYVSCHVGFLPERETEDGRRFFAALRHLVLFAESLGQQFLFETGMESAAGMKQVLEDLSPAQPGINFDPANLLIYDQDDPLDFWKALGDRVQVIHCKDGNRPLPGSALGKETVLGEGATQFSELLKLLLQAGYSGPLVIERELPPGPEQEQDIVNAIHLIKTIMEEMKDA